MKKISDKERAKRLMDKCDRLYFIGVSLFMLITIITNILRKCLGGDHLAFKIFVIIQFSACILTILSAIGRMVFGSKYYYKGRGE